ncbi:hypothetical protein BDY19DRAFT_998650 [Irpex rosettiformis]|uniref:Uncharacterized protein n=1 Tax=Irpex rosettiformis TaxID=378272 RepID=A0ACB8TMZ4_9APHY|nr:hypothetical protein BDY19DRAFT_998650 [Irpex rosettiformis]
MSTSTSVAIHSQLLPQPQLRASQAVPSSRTNGQSATLASQGSQSGEEDPRRRQVLHDVLTARAEEKEARKRKRNGAPLDPKDTFKLAARIYSRCYSPFISLFFCFRVGSVCDINNPTDPTALLVPDDPQMENFAYKAFLQLRPGLVDYFLNTDQSIDADAMGAVVEMIDDTARSARSDDTTGLKQPGLNYILLDLTKDDDPTGELSRSLLAATEKSQRGFNNLLTGKLLCPHRYSDVYAADPARTCQKFLTGALPCKASLLPTFLYGGPYNPDDKYEGLLRGPLCVRVYKHIFKGPSTAGNGMAVNQQNRRKNQAQLMGLQRTTPRTIAYAVVQARHMLNQQADWCIVDDQFDSNELFDMTVVLLECDETVNTLTRTWITNTLDWWDRQVFNKGPRSEDHARDEGNEGDNDHDEEDDFRALMAQRRRVDLNNVDHQ